MSSQVPRPGADNPDAPWPLPRGRHRLPFQVVAENQRRRLIARGARALATHGYAELTVKHVIEAAGISRATFYAMFDNKRDNLGRSFSYDGRRRSYLSASCPAPKGFPGASLPFAKASFGFAGGQRLSSTLTRSCGARG